MAPSAILRVAGGAIKNQSASIRCPMTEPLTPIADTSSKRGRRSLFAGIPILRAIGQRPFEVVVRDPGSRFLSAPRPIQKYASEHWEFAYLSVLAYSQTPAARKASGNDAVAAQAITNQMRSSPEAALRAAGWNQLKAFPTPELRERFEASHLRVEVWEKREPAALAVTFGGTVFDNAMDWKANLRWFIHSKNDEYTAVVQAFAPAFVKYFTASNDEAHKQVFAHGRLFATGHSLGGGLAQQFAYSLPVDSRVPRVKAVYAFDPSPVTGFYSVARELRDTNKKGLFIDRVYERGEILALVRSLTSLIFRPTAVNAKIRGVRYSLFYGWNPIADHSIANLAKKIFGAMQRA